MTLVKKPIPYLWKHAELVYKTPSSSSIKKIPLLKEVKEYLPFSNDTDFAYMAIYDSFIVISFRGTENVKGWISNLDPYPLEKDKYLEKNLKDGKWGRGMIHDGFYDSWLFFKSCVDQVIKKYELSENDYEFYVDGHSRGGALAELCARHLAKNHNISNSCVTFEAPAVGTKRYRDQFRKLPINGTRIVNGWDMVPNLPPKILGFKHGCANKIWIKKAYWKKILMPWLKISDHLVDSVDKAIKKRFMK